MKLSKYKRKLKQEYRDTFTEKKIRKPFEFKFRHLVVGALSALLFFLVIDHLTVMIYNNNVRDFNTNIQNIELNHSELIKVENEKELNSIKEEFRNKTQIRSERKSVLNNIFSFQFLSCSSSNKNDVIAPDESGDQVDTSYKTNIQEIGVDESDISKCDGRYIYTHNQNGYLKIYDLDLNVVASYPTYGNEIYVVDDKVISIGRSNTIILSFDGKTLLPIKEISYNKYNSSRLNDGVLYLLSVNYKSFITYENAYYDGCSSNVAEFTFIEYNLKTSETKNCNVIADIDSILYASNNYFYLASNFYSAGVNYTNISIVDKNLEPKGTIKLEGYINSSFFLDEYNNHLRVVSIKRRFGSNLNALSIFNLDSLERVGYLNEGIGLDNQTVRSVTYDDKYCYIVTYENTDPLYTIDCQDPTNPKIISEYKAPGYSTYLYRFNIQGNEYVLGLGYTDNFLYKISVYLNEDGSTQIGDDYIIGNKFYDMTDYIINGSYDLFSNHKAFFIYNDNTSLYLGLNVQYDKYTVFKINVTENNAKILVHKEIECYNEARGYLINGYFYLVDENKVIKQNF